jgi:DNA-binding NarL/FixJ family response regulator
MHPIEHFATHLDAGVRASPEEALRLWRELLDGAWSLVDQLGAEGGHRVLVRRTPQGIRDPRALTQPERSVASLAAMGHQNKHIAHALGISASTAGSHLASARRKLGIASRAELIRRLAPLQDRREGESAPSPGHGLRAWRFDVGEDAYTLLEWPALCAAELPPAPLTRAETDVVRGVASGLSNAAIACARGTSARTIANQVASAFRKLGVASRLEFHALCTLGRSGGQEARP